MNKHINTKNKKIALVVVLMIISFFIGTRFGQSNNSVQANQMGGNRAMGAGRGLRNQGGFVSGSILSIDSNSITLKSIDGGSRIVFFGSSTPIMKSVQGVADDLVVGKNIIITGQANTDGSVNAQSIQLREGLNK